MSDEEDARQEACNLNYKSISCDQIPELFLDKLVAKKHFSKFGKINRFILRPKRLSCTVEYESEDSAERAFMQAYDFNGHKFIVNYSEQEVGHVQNTEEWVDPDVQAELDAMSPGHRMAAPPPPMILHMRQAAAPPTLPPAKFAAGRAMKFASQMAAPKAPPPPTKLITESSPKVDAAFRNELEAVLRRSAYTDEEKYRVLDARDKLIRLTTVRQTDIKKAVSTKGTCPDMCPEKERLMREFQRQVSSFEMASSNDGNSSSNCTISHRRAIKEYSRSSADQEVPLTHELRTESVLQMTMLYLMHRIMDLCDDPEVSIADWFHFVWDRTRSIRKDITQQELCSLGAVQLVEQCARFHIHCAARLVAEEPSVFDQKINAENLTKCLQTLKYMYHDLRIKNVRCPCEAEFRSYIVLLNLGDANFLWELKQLPTHIQHSTEIKRAIAFYNALQNNNYVRFFEMIRSGETSYLSACILLGYFNKLRLRAMEIIIKSHNWKNGVFLPVKYLTKVLGFEDVRTTAEFLAWHGLQCNEQRVMLERMKKPDLEYSMDRALMLVESKRTVSVGTCVCGQPLAAADLFERHQPHNSFDANGMLKPEAWTAEDQLRGEAATSREAERKMPQQPQPKPTALTVNTDINLFKVPQSSPKQQQQQKHQQQQHPLPNVPMFAGKQLGHTKTPSPQAASNFKFDSDMSFDKKNSSGSSTYSSDPNNTPNSSKSLFKVPMANSAITTKPQATTTSSSAAFFNSIFTPNPEQPAAIASSIFGGAASENTHTTAGNIFGAVAKETANIFQLQPKQPVPLRSDNVFQHFQTETPNFGQSVSPVKANEVSHRRAHQLEEQQNRTAAEQRMRELEEEQRRKQQQLQEERQKLKQLEEKRKSEAAHKIALEQLQKNAAKLTEQELRTLLTDQISQLAHAELSHFQRLDARCRELTQATLAEELAMQVEEIAREEYSDMCHEQMILHYYFQRWLQHTRKKLQQRKLMESTPIWVTTDTRAEQVAKLLHPSQQENLQMIKRYRHGQPFDFKLLQWQSPYAGPPPQVDIFEMYRKHALPAGDKSFLPTRTYLKLLLSLPGEQEELPGLESICNKWLRKYVSTPKAHTDAYICALKQQLALCVRKVSGVLPLNERGQRVRQECDNADAIVCFMSSCNLTNTRKRLHHLLKLSSIQKCVPVAFVVYDAGGHNELMLADHLQLQLLLEERKMSAYKFCGCQQDKCHFRFDGNFKSALRFVLRESGACNAAAESLEMQSLHSWLEANLGQELWQRWHESALLNPPFAKICTMPQHLSGLYNDAVDRLLQLTAVDWQEAPDFAAELRPFVPQLEGDIPCGLAHFPADWKSPNRQQEIEKFLKRLKLPAHKEPLPTADVEHWELWLLNYASHCIPQDEVAATQASYEAINAFIAQLNGADLQEFELSARFERVNFLPVIKALAFAHINNVLKQLSPTATRLPNEVIYRRQDLLDYRLIPWWLNCKPIEAVTVDYSLEKSTCDSANANEAAESGEELEAIVQQAEEISRRTEEQLLALKRPALSAKTYELKRELDESLYQFELAKRFGCYDVSVLAERLRDDEKIAGDVSSKGAVGGTNGAARSPLNKRKRLESATTQSDMDAVIARAFDLIHKMETKQDCQDRVQQVKK